MSMTIVKKEMASIADLCNFFNANTFEDFFKKAGMRMMDDGDDDGDDNDNDVDVHDNDCPGT